MKNFLKINDCIFLCTSRREYGVRVLKYANQEPKHSEIKHCSSLEDCFQTVFNTLLLRKFSNGDIRTLREIKNIVLETRKELRGLLSQLDSFESGERHLKVGK